jgi:serine/threonine protein kinase
MFISRNIGEMVASLISLPATLAAQLVPLAQAAAGSTNWLLYAGVGIVLAIMGALVAIVISAQPKQQKKRGSKVVVGENQIDNYRLLNMMMQGQTSQVWEASEISSGRHFAIKLLLPENAHSSQQRAFLFHEAEVAKQIVHPKIVKILEAVRDKDHPYLVMEFFPSTNLKLRLMHKDPFIKEHMREIIEQTATALTFMHAKKWVHCDVKPDNILVNASADVRLIDFALAKRVAVRKRGLFGRRKRGKSMGTRSYMSPEQIRGEALDVRADVYSFGATIYELLTGRPPFRAATPSDLLTKQIAEPPTPPEVYNPDITHEMSDLVVAMLAKEPEGRPRDLHDFLMKFRKARIFKAAVIQKKKE